MAANWLYGLWLSLHNYCPIVYTNITTSVYRSFRAKLTMGGKIDPDSELKPRVHVEPQISYIIAYPVSHTHTFGVRRNISLNLEHVTITDYAMQQKVTYLCVTLPAKSG